MEEDNTAAVETLEARLVSTPILTLPWKTGGYMLDTDACDQEVGCVLLKQHSDGNTRSVGYWSRTMSPPERSYFANSLECLDVV